jgi:hypothetical protein
MHVSGKKGAMFKIPARATKRGRCMESPADGISGIAGFYRFKLDHELWMFCRHMLTFRLRRLEALKLHFKRLAINPWGAHQ